MIPSSPRRTWAFLLASLALYFAPDLLTPEAWQLGARYLVLSAAYQGALVLLGFAYAPAICRALVLVEIRLEPPRAAVDTALAALNDTRRAPPPVVLAAHPLPFVLTAGLWPKRCEIFISSGLVARLSPAGLRFLLARAVAHASPRQRLAAVLPILVLTVLIPDPKDWISWLELFACMALWLPFHWLFELDADRRAARMLGAASGNGEAGEDGLRDACAATASPLGWLTPHPPLRWRLRAIGGRGTP